MRDTIADLHTLNCKVNDNHVMGLLLQRNLPDGAVKREFDHRVETTMYIDPTHKTPSFDQLIQLLHVCKQQSSTLSPNPYPYTHTAPLVPDLPFSNFISTHPPQSPLPTGDKKPNQVSANVARNNNCHICKQPGHWSADCPHRKKPVPNRNPSTNQPHHPFSPTAYQPYCPIVVAPNFLPYGTPYPYLNIPYPPPSFSHNNHPQPPQTRAILNQPRPTQNQNPARGYDSYKPRYDNCQPNVTAKIVEVGSIEDEMAELQMAGKATADAIGPCPEIIADTGASNHLTGDRDRDNVFSWREWNDLA
ncbi:hypothetical protein PCASD_11600 [Puccinia coronata f. sp. avenae]|uniref:CCHC-type domain-containing protein n=1 Tax=Puccinia coronata f. sp. avenae TaxID=200324 RepID=A0A2N5U8R0_9BASI|nr:hypothetical protein PCASD_11600 [Puccinia coronata f. sp. avenae]